MYLHLGSDTVVPYSDIIGVFDLDNTTVSKASRDFLRIAEKSGMVEYVSYELPKSFVITEDKKKNQRVYISQLNCATLLKRAKTMQ